MRLAAIVLAAGSATRFGGDKLSAPFRGEPLVAHAIRAARAAPVERVILVCGEHLDIGQWTGAPSVLPVRIVSACLSQSLKAGIAAAEEIGGDVDGVFVFLGDMPLIPPAIAGRLAERLTDNFAALPRCNDQPGHPVLLSRRAFPEIAGLEGDQGAGRLMKQRKDIAYLDVTEDAVLLDVDRTKDLVELDKRPGPDE